jgi:hypothetical protein
MHKGQPKKEIKKQLTTLFRSMDFVSKNFLDSERIVKKEFHLLLQAPTLLPFLPPKASGRVWRMGVWKGFEKGPTSPLCLQHSQDPSTLFPLRPFATFGTESLCLGKSEGVFPGGGPTRGWGAWSGHRDPDVWGFFGVQPPLPYSLHGRLFRWEGSVSGGASF